MSFVDLVSLGTVDEDLLLALETCLGQLLGFQTRKRWIPDELSYAFDDRRQQCSSSLILRRLIQGIPSDAIRLLAITERDLFIPMLSFIYGQAQLQGMVAIVSLARLRQEFYGLPPNRPLLVARAIREVIHEAGHTFGLVHCLERTCPMSLATNIRQLDLKGDKFCSNCGILLQENLHMLKRQIKIASAAEERA